jgi:hypothetical protein
VLLEEDHSVDPQRERRPGAEGCAGYGDGRDTARVLVEHLHDGFSWFGDVRSVAAPPVQRLSRDE